MPISNAEIERRFNYHKPKTEAVSLRCDEVRTACRRLAWELVDKCPDSRELSLALTKLEETMMHAISAIVRNQPDGPNPSSR